MRITPLTHMAIFPFLFIAKDLLKCIEITKLFKDRQQLSRCNSLLWYLSRTTITTTSCDISKERAHLSACIGANDILMTLSEETAN